MKNPSWQKEELILALDLYFREDYSLIGPKHPSVIDLSNILNKLPTIPLDQRNNKFRNPDGVYMKLGNFLSIDPTDNRTGLARYGQLDKEVFFEFHQRKDELRKIADTITKLATVAIPYISGSNDESEELEVQEGRVLYRFHKHLERKPTLIHKKKAIEARKGNIICCVCGFDFQATYGELGAGFIECHHTKPISSMKPDEVTKLSDLILVCSNCHRMLHRRLSIDWRELKSMVQQLKS